MLNTEELKKLNENLPKDKVAKIQLLFKKQGITVSYSTVSRVLKGESKRLDVLKMAVKLSEQYKKEVEHLKESLK